MYNNGSAWLNDENITVTGNITVVPSYDLCFILYFTEGVPTYPDIVEVINDDQTENESKADKIGSYDILSNRTFNNRPVWKQRNGKNVLYFADSLQLWFVNNDIGMTTNGSEGVYGWQNSFEDTVWPPINKLFMTGRPVLLLFKSTNKP